MHEQELEEEYNSCFLLFSQKHYHHKYQHSFIPTWYPSMPLGRLHIVSVSLQTSDRRIRTRTFSDNDDDDKENHHDHSDVDLSALT